MEDINMTNKEIKAAVNSCYNQIADAREYLKQLRELCKHESVSEGNYSWRVGVTEVVDICDYCGEVINYNKEE